MAIAEPLDPVDSARAVAEATASKARRSSFYLAMRFLPHAQRAAMYEIYAFCRAVDDIADNAGCRTARRAELDRWRVRIDQLYERGHPSPTVPATADAASTPRAVAAADGPDAPVATDASTDGRVPLAGLARAIERFGLLREDFLAVIDGMQMDLDADIQAPDFAVLDLYCDRVASAVGRLSTQVFGLPRATGVKLAYHLGRALQLTNILRDLDEDAAIDRLYLPRESLTAAGITARTPSAVLASPRLAAACETLARAARVHYVEAEALMRKAPRRQIRAPRLMAICYREILERSIARGWDAPRTRVRIPRLKMLWLLLRYGVF